MKFKTTVQLNGKTATGFQVPEEVVASFGKGKKPPVLVTINGHTYRSTVAVYSGDYFLPLSAENRQGAGVSAGEEVEVDLALDTEPREVTLPPDFADALEQNAQAKQAFEKLSYSHRREHVMAIEGAKSDETRQRRIDKAMAMLRGDKS